MRVEPSPATSHVASAGPMGLEAAGFPPQVNPPWNSWSAVRGNPVTLLTKATWPCGSGVVVPGMTPTPPSAGDVENEHVAVAATHGTAPATSPLSYLQLKPIQGPRSF